MSVCHSSGFNLCDSEIKSQVPVSFASATVPGLDLRQNVSQDGSTQDKLGWTKRAFHMFQGEEKEEKIEGGVEERGRKERGGESEGRGWGERSTEPEESGGGRDEGGERGRQVRV